VILRRIYLLLFYPRAEWDEIARETIRVDALVRSYILPLSLIPPIATVIGMKTFDAELESRLPATRFRPARSTRPARRR